MKIIINFSMLKKGGGQNVALNFLQSFLNQTHDMSNYQFITVKNSVIDKFLIKNGASNIIHAPSNPFIRLVFEAFRLNKYLKKNDFDILYTYFGYTLVSRNQIQVIGSADSNLYYPEINFWEGYDRFTFLIKKLTDSYRIFGLKRSQAIIFENKELEFRYSKLYGIRNYTTTILPSFS